MMIIDFVLDIYVQLQKIAQKKEFQRCPLYVAARTSTQFEFKLKIKMLANLD